MNIRRFSGLRTAALACAGFCLIGSAAQAQTWSYEITPYIWAPKLTTSLDAELNPPVGGSKSLLDLLDGGFLIRGEARSAAWSLLGEFNYLSLKDDLATAATGTIAGWQLDGTMISFMAGYVVHDSADTRIELVGGARAWSLDLATTVLGNSSSANATWIDPLVGARFETDLTDRLTLRGIADIGGFGVGSELQWELAAELDWSLSDRLGLMFGYRHLNVEFSDSGTLAQLEFSGPYIALGFRF